VLLHRLKRVSFCKQICSQVGQFPNYVDHSFIGDLVVHEQPFAFHVYQEAASQFLEVVRHKGLREIHLFHYGGDSLFTVAQRQKDSKAVLIRKAFAHKGHNAEAMIEVDWFLSFFDPHCLPSQILRSYYEINTSTSIDILMIYFGVDVKKISQKPESVESARARSVPKSEAAHSLYLDLDAEASSSCYSSE
jgi:hypothetical protein